LFEKANELSILCSVDVAVIVLGRDKKLYEYSNTDMEEFLNTYDLYVRCNLAGEYRKFD